MNHAKITHQGRGQLWLPWHTIWLQWEASVRMSFVVLTWVKIFLNKLHLEMEDLLLQFTNGVFHFLPSCHHVTEISNLQKHKKQCLV